MNVIKYVKKLRKLGKEYVSVVFLVLNHNWDLGKLELKLKNAHHN